MAHDLLLIPGRSLVAGGDDEDGGGNDEDNDDEGDSAAQAHSTYTATQCLGRVGAQL